MSLTGLRVVVEDRTPACAIEKPSWKRGSGASLCAGPVGPLSLKQRGLMRVMKLGLHGLKEGHFRQGAAAISLSLNWGLSRVPGKGIDPQR